MSSNNKINEILTKTSQQHLLEEINNMSSIEKEKIWQVLENIDVTNYQPDSDSTDEVKKGKKFAPMKACDIPTEEGIGIGKEAVSKGKVGVIILAGGRASRLGCNHPKGMFPISIIKNKTLFQIICEKIIAAEKQYGHELMCSFMVSPQCIDEITKYFDDNNNFGLQDTQLTFFSQPLVPVSDANGKWMIDQNKSIVTSPDGNGSIFSSFYDSEIFQQFLDKGVETLHVLPIDNPLADPFDISLIGYHKKKSNEVSLVVIQKDMDMEDIGGIATSGKTIKVMEYVGKAKNFIDDYLFINAGIYAIEMAFIEKINKKKKDIPLHKVSKKLSVWDGSDYIDKQITQLERFIFDAFASAKKIGAICLPRKHCFSPLKNKEGKNSVEIVQKDLLEKDCRAFSSITGRIIDGDVAFELAADFHYPIDELKKYWQGRALPTSDFIEAILV
jgi:UDP-N-acetylglucosamine/UDP-N-acetylgalactosamine diphosphorylase